MYLVRSYKKNSKIFIVPHVLKTLVTQRTTIVPHAIAVITQSLVQSVNHVVTTECQMEREEAVIHVFLAINQQLTHVFVNNALLVNTHNMEQRALIVQLVHIQVPSVLQNAIDVRVVTV